MRTKSFKGNFFLYCINEWNKLNPLLHNVVKWSDTLSKSCSKSCKIFKVSDHFTTLRSKGLKLGLGMLNQLTSLKNLLYAKKKKIHYFVFMIYLV